MTASLFWDESFEIRALQPVLVDSEGLASPVNIGVGASQAILFLFGDESAKILRLWSLSEDATVSIRISTDFSGDPPVEDTGEILMDLSTMFELPIEGLSAVYVYNTNALAAIDVSFAILRKQSS